MVEIRHVDGYVTRYGHNQANLVQEGQQVRQGQKIATVGATGTATGPHVHFEVLKNGEHETRSALPAASHRHRRRHPAVAAGNPGWPRPDAASRRTPAPRRSFGRGRIGPIGPAAARRRSRQHRQLARRASAAATQRAAPNSGIIPAIFPHGRSVPSMVTNLFKKIFGSRNERLVKKLLKSVAGSTPWSPSIQHSRDAALTAKTAEFRARLAAGAELDDLLPEAFAVVREAGRRALGHAPLRRPDDRRHGPATTARSPRCAPARARPWSRPWRPTSTPCPAKGVHVVTVNDYLARRDATWMGRIYHFLGLSVGVINSSGGMGPDSASYLYDPGYRAAGGPGLPAPAPGHPQGDLRRGHHLRHQQRVRLRLPARQHGLHGRSSGPSATPSTPSSTRWTRS